MKKILLLFVVLIFGVIYKSIAQDKVTVSGTVTDGIGPLPESTVYVKNTTKGTVTNLDGEYSIQVNIGEILVFSYVGMISQEIKITSARKLNVVLKEENTLNEIVVTAQGIKKEKKALGYAITKLDGEELKNKPEADVSRALQGKIAGVQISSASGSSGEPTSISIRSNLSINGNNSPLIVVNNVPFSGNLLDIDPNNIESMSVLKGLNASVLYGSEGRNGVILIQTKTNVVNKGKKTLKMSLSHTSYVNTISGLPEYQNKYGQGSDFNFVGGNLGTWGPAFSEVSRVLHPYSGNPEFPEFNGVMVPYEAKKNNVKNFFREGLGTTTSVSISSTQEKSAFNVALGYTNEEGIIGNNNVKRLNIAVGGGVELTDKWNLDATLNYSNRRRDSYDENELFGLLLYIPRNIDVYNLPYQDSQGRNVYYRASLNPKWLLNNTNKHDDVSRVYGTFNTKYEFNEHINLAYRIGYESQDYDEFDYGNKGGLDDYQFGFLDIGHIKSSVVDQTVLLNMNRKLSDKISIDAQVGANSKITRRRSSQIFNENQIVYGFLRPDNFEVQRNSYSERTVNLAGVFGQVGLSYDNFLYLNVSGRNDFGSTVEPENRQLFYPGVSVSFIPTSAFDFGSSTINYLKIRGAYATSSGFPGAYNTRSTLNLDPISFVSPEYGNIITNSTDRVLANPNLKPELHQEVEVGIESKLFRNRIALEVSAYKRISRDQILPAKLPTETGFSSTTINAGRIDTKGLEIDLGIDILKDSPITWNCRNLFNTYESLVVELPSGDVNIGGSRWAIEGKPLGVIRGSFAMRDSEGNFLVNPNTGFLILSEDVGLSDKIIGNPIPDWTFTNINTLSYKNFTLSTQIEYTHGGESYSDLADDLIRRGVTRDTENREGSFIVPGVYGDTATGLPYLDANGNTIPNTIQLSGNDVAFNHYYNADDLATFDTSVFRIREISLGYTFSKKNIAKLPFQSVVMTLSGRNIYYYAPGFPKYTNIDPELDTSDDNTRTPTTSRYSLSLTFKF